MKKFSVGLSMTITDQEYMELFKKYSNYIDYLYFSIPGEKYQTRRHIFDGFTLASATEKIKNTISIAKQYGILSELALNSYNLLVEDLYQAFEFCSKDLCIMPDAVVSNSSYSENISKLFENSYHILSFNDSPKTARDIDIILFQSVYKEIVFGSFNIRNLHLWEYAHSEKLKVRLLLNNGCSLNCVGCTNSKNCKPLFEANLKKFGIEKLYAYQSIIPSELSNWVSKLPIIFGYKISNRNCSYSYLSNCLESYIVNNETVLHYSEPLYLWCRLAHFSDYYNQIDLQRVRLLKEEIWHELI